MSAVWLLLQVRRRVAVMLIAMRFPLHDRLWCSSSDQVVAPSVLVTECCS